MGARGKKRRRKDGTLAVSIAGVGPLAVPPVEPGSVAQGLAALRECLSRDGAKYDETKSVYDEGSWQAAYVEAQLALRAIYPDVMLADAILWRATLLDALLQYPRFLELAGIEEDAAPDDDVLQVAATIPTNGADRSFGLTAFLKRLGRLRGE